MAIVDPNLLSCHYIRVLTVQSITFREFPGKPSTPSFALGCFNAMHCNRDTPMDAL